MKGESTHLYIRRKASDASSKNQLCDHGHSSGRARVMRRATRVICVVALEGCGGDDGGGGGEKRLTKAESSAEGKRICEAGAKRTEQLARDELAKPEVKKLEPTKQRLHLVEANQPIVEDTMGKLEELKAPEDV